MAELDTTARRIGAIDSVTAGVFTVAVDPEAPHGVALGGGTPLRFPLVNGIVVIPTDDGSVIGLVHSVGIVPSDYPKRPGLRDYGLIDLPFPSRRLGVTPLGVLRLTGYTSDGVPMRTIDRGVLTPPTVGAAVLLPTAEELAAVVEGSTAGARVELGTAALARELTVRVDPDRLFGRHVAVLGNTGGGKSCTVAGLIRWSIEAAAAVADPVRARFVVIDPNGEYGTCLADLANVRVFHADPAGGGSQLRVPAWLWNGLEWAAFSDAARGVQQPLLYQALRLLRAGADIGQTAERRIATLVAGYESVFVGIVGLGPAAYTNFPGTKNVGEALRNASTSLQAHIAAIADDEVRDLCDVARAVIDGVVAANQGGTQYWNAFNEPALVSVVEALAAIRGALPAVDLASVLSEDAPVAFDVADVIGHLEVLAAGEGGAAAQFASTVGLRIRTLLGHERTRAVIGPSNEEESIEQWLTDYLGGDADDDLPSIAVIDLSLVPSGLMHVVAAVVSRVIFEALQRYRRLNGEELPTVLVVDEAHHFVSRTAERDSSSSLASVVCRETMETIAREGRKFGLGLVLSSQRPSEVSPTLLSQCNTFLLHRIVNDRDQELVHRLVPDNLGPLLDELPVLPTQHAILLGWATPVPLLVKMRDLPAEHRPHSDDPKFWATWSGEEMRSVDWTELAEQWRTGAI